MNKQAIISTLLVLFVVVSISAQNLWKPDLGNGRYKNPILYADYSDPDVVKVGDDFYMTASSFNCAPGLPILHSKDLVNWELINYALPQQFPVEVFAVAQHGNGVWAPSIRYHNNEFYIYYGDPDYGIYMLKATDPAGEWSEPILVKEGKGLIDSCPLWDEDGKAYLVHAYAGSRAGIKTMLVVQELKPDGTKVIGQPVIVFDGHKEDRVVEGPKFYKRNGYYYILTPAGGVSTGWQLALRSKSPFGPYEKKVVLHQGKTDINGPHQGGLIDLESGESWFIHFQELQPYGRVVHLNPAKWINDWPYMGTGIKNQKTGEPYAEFKKPNVGSEYEALELQSSDEFNDVHFGLQWQWHANPQEGWGYTFPTNGVMRLYCRPIPEGYQNLWDIPHLFLQKLNYPAYTATTKLRFNAIGSDDKTGLLVMGRDYAYIALQRMGDEMYVVVHECEDADKHKAETQTAKAKVKMDNETDVYLRVKINEGGSCEFYYSLNGKKYEKLGGSFQAREGRWIGAKLGMFSLGNKKHNDAGYADFDWFRVE